MQKRTKLRKAGIAMLFVTCCILFVLYGRPAFLLSTEAPRAEEAPFHNYVLAEDFPEDKIEVFNNFIRYSAPCPIVSARLGLNDKVSYADFLSAVSFALSLRENYRSRYAASFLENVLEPLSHDLQTKEFRGYRFPVDDLPAFFRRYILHPAIETEFVKK